MNQFLNIYLKFGIILHFENFESKVRNQFSDSEFFSTHLFQAEYSLNAVKPIKEKEEKENLKNKIKNFVKFPLKISRKFNSRYTGISKLTLIKQITIKHTNKKFKQNF